LRFHPPRKFKVTFNNHPSHRWHTEAVGSSTQTRSASFSCCAYRVMAKSASRAARIIQMFMRIRASPATLGRFWHFARSLYLRAPARQPSRITGKTRAGPLRQCRAVAIFRLLIRVRRLANELPMSKVMQLFATIAPRGFALPTHLNLMSSDARNRARCAELIFADPDDAVTQREPTSHCGIHDDAPD
jgi:hypothetical protein